MKNSLCFNAMLPCVCIRRYAISLCSQYLAPVKHIHLCRVCFACNVYNSDTSLVVNNEQGKYQGLRNCVWSENKAVCINRIVDFILYVANDEPESQ